MSGDEPDAACIRNELARRFSVEDINLDIDTMKITQSKNGFTLRVAVRGTRAVRRGHLPARRIQQTGRDQAVSARGRWAEAQLRYAFKDSTLLDLALTHRSASKANNERLEYLGDSFLNFAIARRLFELRPRRHRRRLEPRARRARQGADARGDRSAARHRRALDARSRASCARAARSARRSSPTPSRP